jgi:hypothetical protein
MELASKLERRWLLIIIQKQLHLQVSYLGGKQLFDWANQRKEPIPVFAEMGSI